MLIIAGHQNVCCVISRPRCCEGKRNAVEGLVLYIDIFGLVGGLPSLSIGAD